MHRTFQTLTAWILPVLIFFLAYAVDVRLVDVTGGESNKFMIRELTVAAGLILMIWSSRRSPCLVQSGLVQKLRLFGVLTFPFLILEMAFSGDYFGIRPPVNILPGETGQAHFAVLFALTGTIMAVWIFHIIRSLIFIQQSRTTRGNYRFMAIFLILYIISRLPADGNAPILFLPSRMDTSMVPVDIIILALFLFSVFINGFRCKWMHYLNHQQKIAVFFLFIVINVLAVPRVLDSQTWLSTGSFSPLLGEFAHAVLIIMVIYVSMACLGILLQLPAAKLMDQRKKEIESLQTLSATIGSVFDNDALFEKTTNLCKNLLHADFVWMSLKTDDRYAVVRSAGIRRSVPDSMPSEMNAFLHTKLVENRETLFFSDVYRGKQVPGVKRWNQRIGSLVAAPIRLKDQVLGALYAGTLESYGFLEETGDMIQAYANQVAVAIENSRLVQVTIEQERYREELRLAHVAQMRLLPQEMPDCPGYNIQGFCMTANDIGGDFYDVISLSEDRLDLVVGDVSGKGADAAFYMAELKGMIRSLAPHHTSPKDILLEMNEYLCRHFDQQTFVTLLYAILYPKRKQIRAVRAGHPPLGIVRQKEVTWIETKGLGLGISSNDLLKKSLRMKTLPLVKNDLVVMYTDGLVEARNKEGQEFGEMRLQELISDLSSGEVQHIIDETRKEMNRFTEGVSRHDDITLMLVKVNP